MDYLEENTTPRCIILFGSFAKAEYDTKSDIDIFIQAKEQKLDYSLPETQKDYLEFLKTNQN